MGCRPSRLLRNHDRQGRLSRDRCCGHDGVRVLALDERDGQVMDPWQMPGKELVKLSRYLASDWDAARGIFEVAFYRKVGVTGGQLSTKEPEARPPAYQGQLYLRPHGYFQREP